jgi:DNA-binding beta-propeller fold protein YncE
MNIGDIVKGLAAGVGIDLAPDGKTAYYVEWSIGELSKVETGSGKVTRVRSGFKYPEDVEVDWKTNDIFVSERTGEITTTKSNGEQSIITTIEGAPQQLVLVKSRAKRYLYTVCYDSGWLVRIDVNAKTWTTLKTGLGHPVGLVIDAARKYAFVSEQDKGSLTRIELSTGNVSILYTELVWPFFLAWNKGATGIFCVQRDPSNSLVKLKLGPPVTSETIATGLAWRPSGVAPNADNKMIYICADQKLQLISFDGVSPITPDPPPLEVDSIHFNYDGSQAISLKDHVTDDFIQVKPEWIKGSRNEPVAYVQGTLPHIRVVFRTLPGFVGGTYAISAIGNLGGVRRKDVTPNFHPSGLTDPIDFELMWPLPHAIGKHTVSFEWFVRSTAGPAIPIPIGPTNHTICTTWKKMVPNLTEDLSNWVYKNPMLWTSEWAAGKNSEKDICDAIIQDLHLSGLKYGIDGWSVRDILTKGGGMCGGWYVMFQHLAHCQGVFVHRRFYAVDWRQLPNNEAKWCAIVIKAGGLNQPQPTFSASEFHDVNTQYPIVPTTPVNVVTEKRYRFWGVPGKHSDGHCINFLVFGGKLYLYDPSFGTGPFEISPFNTTDLLPANNYSIIGGTPLSSFKKNYLDKAVDYMLGSLHDGIGKLYETYYDKSKKDYINGLSVKTDIIPDLVNGFEEITFYWGP